MADTFRGAIIDELKRDQVHSEDIAATLEHLRDLLAGEGIAFGLVGALALRHYGYTRFTEDVDIVTTRQGLDLIHERLVGRGIVPRASGVRKKLRHTRFKVNIDVITAGEHAGADGSPVLIPSPESDAFVADEKGLRVVTLEKLIELKIASGVWGHRDQDLVDVQKLIQTHRLDAAFAQKLAPAVQSKFVELVQRAGRELELGE